MDHGLPKDEQRYAFVSYAREDGDLIADDLRRWARAGHALWHDVRLDPGTNWTKIIAARIAACDRFVIFLSARSLQSPWVLRELELAIDTQRPILPILLEPLELPLEFRLQIGRLQQIHRHAITAHVYDSTVTQWLAPVLSRPEPSQTREQRLESELSIAAMVQRDLLGRPFPSIPGFDVWKQVVQHGYVGGDMCFAQPMDDGHTLLCLGDVVGHGMGAAVLMASLLGIFASAARDAAPDAGAILTRANAAFESILTPGRFATIAIVVLQRNADRVQLALAGAPTTHLRRTNGDVTPAGESVRGMPIGILNDHAYQTETLTLAPGDCLVMHTDGLEESRGPDDRMLGADRLRQRLERAQGDASAIGQALLDLVSPESGFRQDDDLAVLVIRRMD